MLALAEPLALLFAGLYGVLVLYHMWERWRRPVVVPSLLLWQVVSEDVIRARRFRPDLLFVVQALALAAMILGLARPYLPAIAGSEPTGRHIFVLDTSASMQSREGRQTRFAAAQTAASERLAALPTDTEVMLMTADRAPRVVVDFTRDRAAVAAALAAATPVDVGGDLTVALAFADAARQRTDLPTTIDVFTDLPRSQLPAPVRNQVALHQVGETDDNLAITGLQVFQGRFQDPRSARVAVHVQNFAHRDGHGVMSLELGNRVLSRTGFTVAGRSARKFLFGDLPGPGALVARLEAVDALAADNAAFGWVAPVRPVRILVASASPALVRDLRGLAAAAPGLQVRVVDPRAFTPVRAADADIVILDGMAPAAPLATNALYLFPDRDNQLFPVTADVTDVEVLDWDETHPVLRGLRPLAALPLRRGRVVTPPSWARPIVWSRAQAGEFPLVLAGERDGHRAACITFDLAAERLLSTDRVNLLLLLTNLLGWLAPGGDDAVVTRTGDVRDLGSFPTDTVTVRGPQGTTATLPSPQLAFEPRLAGAYQFSSDGTTRLLFASFFDPVESDIGRPAHDDADLTPAAPPAAAGTLRRDHAPHSDASRPWLYAAALILVAAEWALSTRRPT